MMRELATINRASFAKMENFQLRVNFLRERLNNSDFQVKDKAYLWFVIKGTRTNTPTFTTAWSLASPPTRFHGAA